MLLLLPTLCKLAATLAVLEPVRTVAGTKGQSVVFCVSKPCAAWVTAAVHVEPCAYELPSRKPLSCLLHGGFWDCRVRTIHAHMTEDKTANYHVMGCNRLATKGHWCHNPTCAIMKLFKCKYNHIQGSNSPFQDTHTPQALMMPVDICAACFKQRDWYTHDLKGMLTCVACSLHDFIILLCS